MALWWLLQHLLVLVVAAVLVVSSLLQNDGLLIIDLSISVVIDLGTSTLSVLAEALVTC